MKKGDIITGKIEELRFPNKGILWTVKGDGTPAAVIVKNTLPGQKVEARITKKRSGGAEASLVRIVSKAPAETTPSCPVFGECGGCCYLSLPYEKELEIKERQVRSLLESACGGDISSWFMPVHESPVTTGYRNKMEFTFGDSYKGGPLTLGMHRRGSFYDLADASMCELVDEDYRRIVRCVRNYFAAKGIPFLHRQSHEGYLRHLIVRKASHTGEILVDLVTTTDTKCLSANGYSGTEKELLEGMRDALVSLPLQGRFAGILHTKNDSVADIVEDQGTEILYGQASFEEQILGLRFLVTPFSFFQTNSYGAEVLYSIARDYIRRIASECSENRVDKKPVVFDLYCGTGTISQLVSPSAAKVIGVEIVEEAVTAARENAKKNGITNCTFIAGDVLRVIDEIEEKPDLIILDPPRDGVHPKAMPKLIAYGVPYILYISCKATSLARDLPVLREGGYVPVAGTCVDQFPRTANIETICAPESEDGRLLSNQGCPEGAGQEITIIISYGTNSKSY